MQVDHVVDERRDPFLASVAAARLLRSNYEKTGTWPLAITAYNHGAGGMNRAVRKLGTRDIATIIDRYKSRTFGFASRNFYCEFLAARYVSSHAERYFGPIRKDQPDDPEIVVLDHYYKVSVLTDAFGVASTELRRANPALLQPIWSGQKYLPRGYGLRLPRQPGRASPKVVLASIPSGHRFAKQVPDRSYRVKRGDTLSKIARRFGVRESEIVALNGLRSRHRIRIGQKLKLPVHGAALAQSSSPSVAPEPIPADGLYRVRRGDNVDLIARRFGVSVGDLVAANRIRNKNRIQVGQVLQIPGGSVTARAPSNGASSAGVYVVRKGDTLHGIARRFETTEATLTERNGLRSRHHIQVGQRLYIPGAPAEVNSGPVGPVGPIEVALAAAPAATPHRRPDPAADSPRLPLSPRRYQVAPDGSIRIQPDETLGHIAEWLELAPSSLRRINGLVRGQPIALGGRLKLDYTRVPRAIFEKRRLAHHRRVQEAFYGAYAIAGTQEVVLKQGDTLWKIAEGNGPVPVWLLLEYNPGVEAAALRAGQRVRVPRLKRRS
jgi:membrane-bound lytic murein transglycosylase D